ncbi:MAG: ABC transporter substrate-binding protein [Deltaproteobacteria bacterium]|jgi:polar amino acid transport system substrate-binding protein|nr:ABC transporter substrate-binding protein [Deltaproteobacteria bacterium]
MKKILFTCLFILTLAASPLLADLTGKTIINGVDANFPPFAFIDHDGQINGFDIESINWIAQKFGFKVNHQSLEWDSLIANLMAKKIDIVSSGLSITAVRSTQISFTTPYWTVNQVVLVSKDSTLTAENVLTGGHKIGVQRGTSEANSMKKSNGVDGRDYTLEDYPSPELAANDVVSGRIMAVVMNDAPAAEITKSLSLKIVGSAGIPAEQFAFGIHKANPELMLTLNQGLKQLMADPFWKTLKKKYKLGELK